MANCLATWSDGTTQGSVSRVGIEPIELIKPKSGLLCVTKVITNDPGGLNILGFQYKSPYDDIPETNWPFDPLSGKNGTIA